MPFSLPFVLPLRPLDAPLLPLSSSPLLRLWLSLWPLPRRADVLPLRPFDAPPTRQKRERNSVSVKYFKSISNLLLLISFSDHSAYLFKVYICLIVNLFLCVSLYVSLCVLRCRYLCVCVCWLDLFRCCLLSSVLFVLFVSLLVCLYLLFLFGLFSGLRLRLFFETLAFLIHTQTHTNSQKQLNKHRSFLLSFSSLEYLFAPLFSLLGLLFLLLFGVVVSGGGLLALFLGALLRLEQTTASFLFGLNRESEQTENRANTQRTHRERYCL